MNRRCISAVDNGSFLEFFGYGKIVSAQQKDGERAEDGGIDKA